MKRTIDFSTRSTRTAIWFTLPIIQERFCNGANLLDWWTIAIEDDGRNVHKTKDYPASYQAQLKVSGFSQLLEMYKAEMQESAG